MIDYLQEVTQSEDGTRETPLKNEARCDSTGPVTKEGDDEADIADRHHLAALGAPRQVAAGVPERGPLFPYHRTLEAPTMSTKSTTQLLVRYPTEWHPRLLELCQARGIDPDPPRGRAGGLSLLVRLILAEAIGAEVVDPHEEQSGRFAARREKKIAPSGAEGAQSILL
jgi:hypothetical protein